MSKLDKDQIIAKFTAAYEAANGKAPEIEAKGGWYSVDGGKNVRLAALDDMADELSGGKTANVEEAKEEAAPVVEAPKAAPKKAAKKSSAAKASFSVKSYWIEQLDRDKPGSIAPR